MSIRQLADVWRRLVNVQTVQPFTRTQAVARPHGFARRIAGQHHRPLGANPLEFLASHFGEKFTPADMPAWPGSMIYQEPGSRPGKAIYRQFVQYVVSLSMQQLLQKLHVRAKQASAIAFFSTIERSTLLRELLTTQRQTLSLPLPLTTIVHREAPGHILANISEVFFKAAGGHGKAGRTSTDHASAPAFCISFPAITLALSLEGRGNGGTRPLRHARDQKLHGPTKEPFTLSRPLPFPTGDTAWAAQPFSFGSPNLWVANATHAIDDADVDHLSSVKHDLTLLRAIEHLPTPQLSYVYTQPARPIAEEHHVVKTVEKTEVVEMVRKEVQTAMSSDAVVTQLSRAAYRHMTDQVYATLARRLIVEKERLGLPT